MTQLPDETDENEAGTGDAKTSSSGRRKLLMIIAAAAAVVALLGGSGAALYFFGLIGGHGDGDEAAAATATNAPPSFYALPDLVVTLNAGERRTRYLKARVSLELSAAQDASRVERVEPRIVDYCQTYLRELRPDELRGTAAIVRMRDELLKRVNAAVAPVTVREILFTDLMVE
ncbi:MAG: flagellar basal body-associated FliL family protein [Rhodospirillales bacterium]